VGNPVVRVLIAKESATTAPVTEINKRAVAASIPVRVVPRVEIDRLAEGLNHQGVVAIVGRYRYTPLDRLLAIDQPMLVFLDGITDPHNLGSLLRSADGAGFHGVVVPIHRSAGVTSTVRKVAAGAAEVVPVARVGNLGVALEQAKQAGLWVVGLDERASEGLWNSELLEPPLALVLGAEGRGLSKNVRDRCDGFVRIPSGGRLASLNVGVAGALAMFELARRRSASANL
jgi:23S rRNA (guanosine2251-2'-O)-methyltransferase